MVDHIWTDAGRRKWPRDAAGYLFLGRAVDRLGEAMFGNDWQRSDPLARPIDASAVEVELTAEEHAAFAAARAVREPVPAGGRSLGRGAHAPAGSGVDPHILGGIEARRRELADQRGSAAQAAIDRFNAVRDALATAAEAKGIATAYRDEHRGLMMPIPSEWWNFDNLPQRFAMCQIKPGQPSSNQVGGPGFVPVFVDKASFEALEAVQPNAPVRPFDLPSSIDDDVHLSPYIKLMIDVIRAQRISPSDQSTVDSLTTALQAAWTGKPDALSPRLAKALAQAIREPESRENPNRKRPAPR